MAATARMQERNKVQPLAVGRVAAIDVARGLIMALMALDHVRMYFSAAQFDPAAIGATDAGYFATRWITHLCAPGFFFLAGLGVFLAEQRGQPPARSAQLLASRGAWLILLEFTLIGFAWSFVPGWSWFGVIWSLGASMICLALLRFAPKRLLAFAAGAFLLLHNHLPMAQLLPAGGAFDLLYASGETAGRWVVFPLLPWLAVMTLGYAAGPWLMPAGDVEPARFFRLGAAAVVAFVVLRVAGLGEPAEGGALVYRDAVDSAMSFLNVEKYPPSTQYVLVTLGLLFVLTALFATAASTARWLAPLEVFGRVPFAFYLMHLYLIHGLACLSALAFGWPFAWLIWSNGPNLTPPDGFGTNLAGVYAAWFAVLLFLYPACAWFARVKSRSGRLWTKFL